MTPFHNYICILLPYNCDITTKTILSDIIEAESIRSAAELFTQKYPNAQLDKRKLLVSDGINTIVYIINIPRNPIQVISVLYNYRIGPSN